MPDRFDVIVIGMGPGGEVAASKLLDAGRSVAVVERELIGGECAYWACIPSKTLLRPTEARSSAQRSAGVDTPALDWRDLSAYRDEMVRHLDDTRQIKSYEQQGATVYKGSGRIVDNGAVEVDGERLEAPHVVVATGSDPSIPPVEGLEGVTVWTNREATTLQEVPESAVVIGGGPVGIELGQFLRRFGTEVHLVQSSDRVLNREDHRVSAEIHRVLEDDGVTVHVGRRATSVRKDGSGARLLLDDDRVVTAQVIVVGAGRRPRVQRLGLESVGVDAGGKSLPVDDTCRLRDGLWAIGDATGVMLFTHVAKYQGRVVAANIIGRAARAQYRAIPRVVFSDPEIAAVGMTEDQARRGGIDVAASEIDMPEVLARPWTYEREPRGRMGLVADRTRGVLVGAWAVAPLASEWIHEAVLAIRAAVPIPTLLDTVAQFPSFTEGYLTALEKLEL